MILLNKKLMVLMCMAMLSACGCTPISKKQPDLSTQNNQNTANLETAINAYQQKNYATALTQFQMADSAGNKIAPRYLGLLYLHGYGVKKDEKLAFSQFQRAAQYGDVGGQYWLAYCYENGIGTSQDLTLAKQYYVQSAQRADYSAAPALFALGRWYEKGVSGKVDKNRAANYYQLAAATGYTEAQDELKKLNLDTVKTIK